MTFSPKCRKYFLSLIIIILQFEDMRAEEVCNNLDLKRHSKIGLSESQFWTSKSQDFEQCAKLCIRYKMCRSITYDIQTHICEMNSGTQSDTPTRAGITLEYSEFDWWPASLDANCHSRPCDVSETCIPGTLLTGSSGCSYSCITFSRDVCPLPPWGVTNGRTVGSVNSYTCEAGTVGGGTATCLDTKQWDNDISPICTDVYRHPCNSSFDPCHQINGLCSTDGKCECGNYKNYSTSDKKCHLDCGNPVSVANAQLLDNNANTRTYQCNPDYHPTAASTATITCTETGWQPANSFSCFTCGEPGPIAGASVHDSGMVRKYVCDVDDPDHLYPVPGTGNGTITCDEASSKWIPTGFQCGGLRLKPNHPKMSEIPNSGYLELFANGEWRAVTHETWDWQRTKVACKKLGFNFGGTFHNDWFDEDNPNRLADAYKLDNIECTGDEDSLEQCPNFNYKNGDINKEVALTCFDYDIFAHGIIRLDPGPDSGAVIVKLGDAPESGVCGDGWDDKATKVVCRSIRSTWLRDGECRDGCISSYVRPFKTDRIDCKDDEPHLFYCENKGWGNYADTDCDLDKIVQVHCDTTG